MHARTHAHTCARTKISITHACLHPCQVEGETSNWVTCPVPPVCNITKLASSGGHLSLSNITRVPNPGVYPTVTNVTDGTSFNGAWAAPANWGWQGAFTATGPVTDNAHSGTTVYDFHALNLGLLPASTFFTFADVDGGSGAGEIFRVRAFDAANSTITTPWLSSPQYVLGTGRGIGGAPTVLDMPSWSFNAGTGEYVFDGSTINGFNPSVGFAMLSQAGILRLEVIKGSNFNGFALAAPVSEGGALRRAG